MEERLCRPGQACPRGWPKCMGAKPSRFESYRVAGLSVKSGLCGGAACDHVPRAASKWREATST